MSELNLTKDKKWIFKKPITKVKIYKTEIPGPYQGEAGYLEKASVKITVEPRLTELINGSNFQLGYDVSFEVVSLQLYSAFEFDKLKNENCYINLPDVPLWLRFFDLNVKIETEPGQTRGTVTISGSKFVDELTNAMAADVSGNVFSPWANQDGVPVNPENAIPGDPATEHSYIYVLTKGDPLQEFITPPAPEKGDDITELKLTVVTEEHQEPVEELPANVVLQKFVGTSWEVIIADDYEIVYESGVYKIHFTAVAADPVLLDDQLRLDWE